MVQILDRDEDGEEDTEIRDIEVTVDEGRFLLYGSIDGKIDRLLDFRNRARTATSLEEISLIITQLTEEFSVSN